MVDRHARRRLALALRRFAAGRATRHELELVTIDLDTHGSQDPAIHVLCDDIYWAFLNFGPARLIGRHSLAARTRHNVARWVLFLHSDEPYEWRTAHGLEFFRALWSNRCHYLGGDIRLWPFISSEQLARAASNWPFVNTA